MTTFVAIGQPPPSRFFCGREGVVLAKSPLEVLQAIVFEQVRQRGEISQRQAAELVGVSKDAVGAWENMKRLPTAEYAERLANYLGMHVVEFWAIIYGHSTPTGDRTWAEIGETIADRDYEELHSNLPVEELVRKTGILNKILQHRFPNSENP